MTGPYANLQRHCCARGLTAAQVDLALEMGWEVEWTEWTPRLVTMVQIAHDLFCGRRALEAPCVPYVAAPARIGGRYLDPYPMLHTL